MKPGRVALSFCLSFCLPCWESRLPKGSIPRSSCNEEPTDSWPTYNGDYSGRRFSPLAQIHAENVRSLSLAWMFRVTILGTMRGVGEPEIKSTPLMVNGSSLLHHSRSCLCAGCAHRPGAVALRLGRRRRSPGRKSWSGHVRRLAVLPGARWLVHLSGSEDG